MALGQKEIRLSIKANTAKFEEALRKLPNVSEKEAKKMAKKMAKEFDRAEKSAKKNAKKMERSFKGSFKAMAKDAKKLKNLLGPAMFAGAAIALFKLANSASEYTDKIMLMEAQTGISNETLIGMEFAAGAAGASLDELQSGINAFVMKAGQAHNIGGAAADVFDRLGVAVTGTGGELRSTEEIFRDTIDAISGLDTAQERATTSAELFGSRGAKLAAVFEDGSGSIDEWAAAAANAGIVMDNSALRASAKMDRAMAGLQLSIRGFVQTSGNELIPTIVKIAEGFLVVVETAARVVTGFDIMTDAIFGNIRAGQSLQDKDRDVRTSLAQLREQLVENADTMIEYNGVQHSASSILDLLTQKVNNAADAQTAIAAGTELSADEQDRYNQMTALGAVIAQSLGSEWLDMTSSAERLRLELEGMGDVDLSGLGEPITAGAFEELSEEIDEAAESLAAFEEQLVAMAEATGELANQRMEAFKAGISGAIEKQANIEALAVEASNERKAAAIALTVKAEEEAAEAREDIQQRTRQAAQIGLAMTETIGSAAALAGIESAKLQKALAASEITISGLVAGAEALTVPVVGPFLAASIAAATAASLAELASTPVPTMHSGGIVGGGAGANTPINAQAGEALLNRQAVANIGAAGVDALNSGGGFSAPIVVQMTYRQRLFDEVVIDNLKKGGPLKSALRRAGRRR